MNRNAILSDLQQAERHVRVGAAALRQQEEVLAELTSRGHDTSMAETLYRSFAGLQDCYLANRRWLATALAQADAASPQGAPAVDSVVDAADNGPSSVLCPGQADG